MPQRSPFHTTTTLVSCALVLVACSGDVQSRSGTTNGPPGTPGGSSAMMPGGATPGATPGASPGSATDAAGNPVPRPMSLEGDPIYSRFVRLSNEQWQHAVQDILG